MIATFGAALSSAVVKSRPASSGMCSARKKPGVIMLPVTIRTCRGSFGCPSMRRAELRAAAGDRHVRRRADAVDAGKGGDTIASSAIDPPALARGFVALPGEADAERQHIRRIEAERSALQPNDALDRERRANHENHRQRDLTDDEQRAG